MTQKIKNANLFFLQNLFWIIPLFFVTMISGFVQAIYQRDKNDMEIITNTETIQHQIEADTTVMPKVDSLKETLNKLK